MPEDTKKKRGPQWGLDPKDRKTWPGKGGRAYIEPRLSKREILEKIESGLPEMIDELQRLGTSPETPDWAKIKIGEMFLERVYGKPTQAITGADGGAIQVSVEALSAKIAAIANEPPSQIGPPEQPYGVLGPIEAELVRSSDDEPDAEGGIEVHEGTVGEVKP